MGVGFEDEVLTPGLLLLTSIRHCFTTECLCSWLKLIYASMATDIRLPLHHPGEFCNCQINSFDPPFALREKDYLVL